MDHKIAVKLEQFYLVLAHFMGEKRISKDRREDNERRRLASDRRQKAASVTVDLRSDMNRRLNGTRRLGLDRRGLGDIL